MVYSCFVVLQLLQESKTQQRLEATSHLGCHEQLKPILRSACVAMPHPPFAVVY
jgi:hypothetical protein